MKKIMSVEDVFESIDYGTIIVGRSPDVTSLVKIGEKIVVRTLEYKELELNVVSVQVSNSPTDKIMIGICIGKSIKPIDIPVGSTAYVIS